MKTQSGEVRPDLEPRAILTKRGKVTGVQFEGRNETIGCAHVLCGLGADRVAAARLRGWREAAQAADRGGRDRAGGAPLRRAPGGAARRPARRARPPRLCRRRSRRSRSPAPTRSRSTSPTATASTPCSASRRSLPIASPEALRTLRTAVRRELDKLLPFVDRHLLLVHSPHDGIAARGRRRRARPAPPPLPMEPIWSMPKEIARSASAGCPTGRASSTSFWPRGRCCPASASRETWRPAGRRRASCCRPSASAISSKAPCSKAAKLAEILLAVFVRAKMVACKTDEGPHVERRRGRRAPFVAAVKHKVGERGAAGAGAEPRADRHRAQATAAGAPICRARRCRWPSSSPTAATWCACRARLCSSARPGGYQTTGVRFLALSPLDHARIMRALRYL